MAFLKLLVFLTSFSLGCGLYEDQIGKFDWYFSFYYQILEFYSIHIRNFSQYLCRIIFLVRYI